MTFARRTYERKPQPLYAKVARSGVISLVSGVTTPIAKMDVCRNPHLLAMARGKPCLIRSHLCNFDPETTVACHGGGVENGKGMGFKVSDALTCWGCHACNHYTDAYGGATKADKRAAFDRGYEAQVCEWEAIAGSTASDPKDRAAAEWALNYRARELKRQEGKEQ